MSTKGLIDSPTSIQLAFCDTFKSGIYKIVGDKLHSFYLYGAMLFPRPAAWRVDVDFHVILTQPLSADQLEAIKDFHKQLIKLDPLGEELDGYYILLADAKKHENPRSLVWEDAIDMAWPLHRAHVHKGKFKLLFGENPQKFLPASNWSECVEGLTNELQFIKDHPQYPQFGILNLSRLLYSWQTQNVVISKYESAQWALQNLESKWQPAIEAALRDYEDRMKPGDTILLKNIFPDFLNFTQKEIEKIKLA